MCEKCGHDHTPQEAKKVWRKSGKFGRLYFKADFRHWRTFDGDDVAMSKNGASRSHFKTYGAIIHMALNIYD